MPVVAELDHKTLCTDKRLIEAGLRNSQSAVCVNRSSLAVGVVDKLTAEGMSVGDELCQLLTKMVTRFCHSRSSFFSR